MADTDVNEDLLDYEEEENTEQTGRLPRMEQILKRKGLLRVIMCPSTAAGSGISY